MTIPEILADATEGEEVDLNCTAAGCSNWATWETDVGFGYCDLHIDAAVHVLISDPDASPWCSDVRCFECGSQWDNDDRNQHRCGSTYF